MIRIRTNTASSLAVCARLLDRGFRFKVDIVYGKQGYPTGDLIISVHCTKGAFDRAMVTSPDVSTYLPMDSAELTWRVL